jgi:hypothetical protein
MSKEAAGKQWLKQEKRLMAYRYHRIVHLFLGRVFLSKPFQSHQRDATELGSRRFFVSLTKE